MPGSGNKIKVTHSLKWARGGDSISAVASNEYDQNGSTAIFNIQTIGTTSESISFGDVTDAAWIFFKNLDTSNKIYVASIATAVKDGTSAVVLEPGKSVLIPTTVAAWTAIAATSASNLLVMAINR